MSDGDKEVFFYSSASADRLINPYRRKTLDHLTVEIVNGILFFVLEYLRKLRGKEQIYKDCGKEWRIREKRELQKRNAILLIFDCYCNLVFKHYFISKFYGVR